MANTDTRELKKKLSLINGAVLAKSLTEKTKHRQSGDKKHIDNHSKLSEASLKISRAITLIDSCID